MLLKNNTKRKFVHSYLDDKCKLQMIILQPNSALDVPKEVAESWLKVPGIEQYVEPKKAKELEDENAKLKAELTKLKSDANELEQLKAKADELGIKYQKNIGIAKLKEKIDAVTK